MKNIKDIVLVANYSTNGLFSILNGLISSSSEYLNNENIHINYAMKSKAYGEDFLDAIFKQSKINNKDFKEVKGRMLRDRKKAYLSYERYIKPIIKKEIEDEINSFVANNFKEKTLGIHIRSTDRKKDKLFGDKWNRISEKDVVNEVCLIEKKYDKIFIATDYVVYRDALIKAFGGKVCFYSNNISKEEAKSIHHNPDFDKKQNVKEVFIDAMLLSKCSYLLRTTSNVSYFSLVANPDLNFLDLSLKYNSYNSNLESFLNNWRL